MLSAGQLGVEPIINNKSTAVGHPRPQQRICSPFSSFYHRMESTEPRCSFSSSACLTVTVYDTAAAFSSTESHSVHLSVTITGPGKLRNQETKRPWLGCPPRSAHGRTHTLQGCAHTLGTDARTHTHFPVAEATTRRLHLILKIKMWGLGICSQRHISAKCVDPASAHLFSFFFEPLCSTQQHVTFWKSERFRKCERI